jgi:hypothetical protein
MAKFKRRLKNVTVNEVSLVDKAANQRNFLLFKRDVGGNESDEVNASFNKLPGRQKLAFLESLKTLAKAVQRYDTGEDDGETAILVNYEFECMTDNEKMHFMDRINTAADAVQKIMETRAITSNQKAGLIDLWKAQVALVKLQLRNPALAAEFNEAAERRDNAMLALFDFDYDAAGIPIITKSRKGVIGETKTHEAVTDNYGRTVWRLKQQRTPDGKFKS